MLYRINKRTSYLRQINELIIILIAFGFSLIFSIYIYYHLPVNSIISQITSGHAWKVNGRLVPQTQDKEQTYPYDLIKPKIDLKSKFGRAFNESMDYLHNINSNMVDWTSAVPLFSPPFSVRQAGSYSFLYDNLEHYSQYNGDIELRNAIIKRFNRDNISNINSENIVVHTSVFEILDAIYDSLKLDINDSILIPTPTFGYYVLQASKHNIKVDFIHALQKTGWKIQPDALDKALTKTKAKIFLFTNPVNPTGVVYTKEEVEKLAKVLKKHKTLVLSDEVFKDILLCEDQKPYSIGAVEGMGDLTVTLNGVGKSMGLAGLRVSFASMPSWLQQVLYKPLCGLSKPAEKAATAALQNTDENCHYLKHASFAYKEKLNQVKALTKALDKDLRHKFDPYSTHDIACLYVEPQAANVALVSFPGIKGKIYGSCRIETGVQLASYLAQHAGVALVPGEASFFSGHEMVLRIPLSAPNLKQGFEKIKKALLQLHN